jgi:hypothetical protein
MWDQFRKALPTLASACSATKTWVGALLEGESFVNASKAAEKKYNSALHSNRLKTTMNQRVDQAQKVVEAIVDELGFGNKSTSSGMKSSAKTKPAPKKKAVAQKPAVVKKAKAPAKKPVAVKKQVVTSVAKKAKPAAKKTLANKPAKKKT